MTDEKHIDFMRKYKRVFESLIYGRYFLANRGQVTIQNNLDPTNTLLKNNDFKSKKLLGEKRTAIKI